METDRRGRPQPAEDFRRLSLAFAKAVEEGRWAFADEVLRVAFKVADWAERHGERIDG